MSEMVLNTNTLPSPIRERFDTQKIAAKSYGSGVILMPFKDIIAYRGVAKGSGFTSESLLDNRKNERMQEDKVQGQ